MSAEKITLEYSEAVRVARILGLRLQVTFNGFEGRPPAELTPTEVEKHPYYLPSVTLTISPAEYASVDEAVSRFDRLVDSRSASRGGRGKCCVEGCTRQAAMWMRDTTEAGVRAVAVCLRHERRAETALRRLSMEEAVRLATPGQKRKAAARYERLAQTHARLSADTRGASSATHGHALLSGYYAQLARAEEEFLQAAAEDRS